MSKNDISQNPATLARRPGDATSSVAKGAFGDGDPSPVGEVELGLPNERKRISISQSNMDYYHRMNEQFVAMKTSEQPQDYLTRPKRVTPIVRRVIDLLSQHLYSPGPTRLIENDEVLDELMQKIYRNNDINSIFQSADAFSLLNDVAAIEAQATQDPDDPIKLLLWGSEEFAVWVYPNDPTRVYAICTIARYNEKTKFTLWTAATVDEFESAQLAISTTANGRTAKRLGPTKRNPYGVIPFSFVHAYKPVRQFWTPGIGEPLRKANSFIDEEMSNAANGSRFYGNPIMTATNVDEGVRLLMRPGSLVHIPGRAPKSIDGALPPDPKIEFLYANLNYAGIWEDINNHIQVVLEGFGVPLAAFRMDQQSAMSGVAIIAEQAPLLSWTKHRQSAFVRYETDLARVILNILYAAYDWDALTERALSDAVTDLQFTVTWSEPEIPIPGPDRDQADEFDLMHGLTSEVQLLMRRKGITRDQALRQLAQAAEDRAALIKIQQDNGLMAIPTDDSGEEPVVDGSESGGKPEAEGNEYVPDEFTPLVGGS